jgi:hypothetical protein
MTHPMQGRCQVPADTYSSCNQCDLLIAAEMSMPSTRVSGFV